MGWIAHGVRGMRFKFLPILHLSIGELQNLSKIGR